MDSFKNKNVVITGAGSGVGRALAHRFAREGANLLLADIEEDRVKSVADQIGDAAEGMRLDVTDRAAVFAMADMAFGRWGHVDAVFNNAGVGGGGGATNWVTPEKAYRWAFEVNFFGPLHGLHAFLPRMVERGEEAIISATSSGAGIVFPPMSHAYSASKAALIALWETTQHQLDMNSSLVRAALLFPGPHVVNSDLMNSQRNLQAQYDDPALRAGSGINSIESFQATMKMVIGHEVDLTEPEDFADYVHDAVLDDKFWVLPLTDKTKQAIRLRTEEMLTQSHPTIPQMM
ncbi:SDR family NAD(P)-dependent oxidoreductase [Croceicoccus sp. F390]|uniref:SDR family NAD(P)-dependent oxidoreductase n=1 Tax=Croceicoccus esteveae TaxID=3075597 RepID=A0ABU2ZIF5_9SPHN|nr:SDR family NAD(P)-dependent oxidoreductase [Croceicoccus sp. F390]MDT0575192.1 SDR family NAD(P)-dependent oxidoreductase [Croceicoccus sp. F390]